MLFKFKFRNFLFSSLLGILVIASGTLFSHYGDKNLLVGDKAPNITCENMIGNCTELDDLSGKMVLLEFWGSSNRSSMTDHQELEKIYAEFKDRKFKGGNGFEVYSVALDDSQQQWEMATKRDKNSWIYTMRNPKRWNSKAALDYNIQSVPRYFLINGDGEIIHSLFMIKELPEILEKYAGKPK